MKTIGIMLDCSRNAVRNVTTLKKLIDISKKIGMNRLYLYIEDVYEIEGEPYFGYMRGRYSLSELKEVATYGDKNNVTVVPCFQTLAHLNQMFRWEKYKRILDINDILLTDEEKTYELIDKMFLSMSKAFTCSNYNVGMDEAFMLGHGKHFLKHGLVNKVDLFMNHLSKVNEIAKKYGKTISIWSDMLYRTALKADVYYETKAHFDLEFINKIPHDVNLIYWDYYHEDKKTYLKMIANHKKLGNPISFATGIWTWTGFVPSNTYSFKVVKPGIQAAIESGVDDIIITAWGDNGGECSIFSSLPSIFYSMEIAKGITKLKDIKQDFYDLFNIKFDDFMKLDFPNLIEKGNSHVNPGKYLLYNDPFLGTLDSSIRGNENEIYKGIARKLKSCKARLNEYSYLADYMYDLAKVLSYKACLGYKTREAYQAKDLNKLANLIPEYKLTIKYLNKFIVSFKNCWNKENKPFGFEIQEYRLGGLILRLNNCIKTLNLYINHKIDEIPELEIKLLDLNGLNEEDVRKEVELINNYELSSSMNRF